MILLNSINEFINVTWSADTVQINRYEFMISLPNKRNRLAYKTITCNAAVQVFHLAGFRRLELESKR